MLREQLKKHPVLWASVLVGLLCALILIGFRVAIEREYKDVSVVMTYQDMEVLAEAAEQPLVDYMKEFKAMGVAAVLLSPVDGGYSYDQAEAAQAAGLDVALVNAHYMPLSAYNYYREMLNAKYPLYIGNRLPLAEATAAEQYFRENDVTIGLVEEKGQRGHTAMFGFKNDTEISELTRVFRLIPSFAQRYAILGYEGPQEIENIFYRAATDRHIRVLIMTPFVHSETGAMITDPAEYASTLADLDTRISRQGLDLTDGHFGSIAYYQPNPLLLALLGLGVCALSILLLLTLFPLSVWPRRVLFALSVAVCGGGVFLLPEYTQPALALLAAIIFPCCAIYAVVIFLKERQGLSGFGQLCVTALTAFLLAVGIALLGGTCVGATLSGSNYMLEMSSFRGVKISQMVPLLYAVWIIYRQLFYSKGHSLFSQSKEFLHSVSRRERILLIAVLLLMLLAVCFYILRTGDRIIQAGALEQRFRIFLETELVVRPRTKEFLVGWPALLVAAFFMAIRCKRYAWPFLFFATVGCASAVNTFCHIRSDYTLSLLRTVLGAGFGLVIGLIAVLVLYALWYGLIEKRRKSVQKDE